MADLRGFSVFLALLSLGFAEKCLGPTVDAQSYSTPETVVSTSTVLISEFKVTCKNGLKGLNLYAEIAGITSPISYNADSDKYQVSYSAPHNKLSSGTYKVRVYDDEGFTALRKAQRTGEETKDVKPLALINISHSGVWKGTYMKTEYLAVLVAALVFYLAHTQKNGLQS